MLCLFGRASAQGPRLELRAGYLASSTLVEDLVAVPALLAQYGQGGSSPRAWAAASPVVSAGATLLQRERLSVSGLAGWQPTQLQVEDAGGRRDVQDLSLVHALLEVTVTPRVPLSLSGGIGVLSYRAEELGLFDGGADVSPLVRLGAGAGRRIARHLASVRVLAEYHRFSTEALKAAGGQAGGVVRYGAEFGLMIGGAR